MAIGNRNWRGASAPDQQGAALFPSIQVQKMLDISEKYLGNVVILVDITDYRVGYCAGGVANRAKSAFLGLR